MARALPRVSQLPYESISAFVMIHRCLVIVALSCFLITPTVCWSAAQSAEAIEKRVSAEQEMKSRVNVADTIVATEYGDEEYLSGVSVYGVARVSPDGKPFGI